MNHKNDGVHSRDYIWPHYSWHGHGPFPYALESPHTFQTGITGYWGRIGRVSIDQEGMLTIQQGFIWDGATGPAFDDPAMLVASLAHDATCILSSHLGFRFRRAGDGFFRDVLLANGAPRFRAWYSYLAVTAYSYKVRFTAWQLRGSY
jgi:hypothetical protein